MKYNYKRTFDAVHMSEDDQKRIRSELSSHFVENKKEDNILKIKGLKKIRKSIVAAVAILAIISAGAVYAYNSQVIRNLTGGWIEYGTNSDGVDYIGISFEDITAPAEVRDGRIYFVLDGSDKDITDYCSGNTYYSYEHMDDDGYRHIIAVGGTATELGWAEWVIDENGKCMSGGGVIHTYEGTEQPWVELAAEEFGVNSEFVE